MTPTARALAHCRRQGWHAHVVERWIPMSHRRVDVWGFGDVLVVDDKGAVLVQVTSTGNMSSRVKKIRGECWGAASAWLGAGCRIQVWGYAKRGKAGERKLWTLRVVDVQREESVCLSA